MSDTTTKPLFTTAHRLRLQAVGLVLALAIGGLAYLNARKYGLLPSGPRVTVTTECDSHGGIVNVALKHFPPGRADVVMYTAGDVWATGYNPAIHDGTGWYSVSGTPAGPVTVEVTPQGRTTSTWAVDVPTCAGA